MSDLLRRYPDPELERLLSHNTEHAWLHLQTTLSRAFELIDEHPQDDQYRQTIERWVRLTHLDWLTKHGIAQHSTQEIARRLGVSPGRVSQLRAQWRDGPPAEPARPGRPKKASTRPSAVT